MFRQKEFMQQPIHLQQRRPIQTHGVGLDGQEPPILQLLDGFGEAPDHVDAEFPLEVSAAHLPELELQNEFADEALVVRGRQRTVNRQFAFGNFRHIRIEVRVVLIMRAADVPKRCHA